MFQKHKKFIFTFSLSLISTIFVLSVVLFSYQRVYAGKIYRNVHFGEIDLSGKTKKQAEFLIENQFHGLLDRTITINANGKSVQAKIEDTGLTFDSRKTAEECYRIGRSGGFLSNLKSSVQTIYRKVPVEAAPSINETKYANFIKIAIAQLNNDPKDATIEIKDGQIIITNGEDGHAADTSNLIDQIINLADGVNNEITLSATESPASVQNADFDGAKSQAENILNKSYLFSYENKNYTPSKAEIGNWIEFKNENGNYSAAINNSNLKAYLNKIAKDFEIKTVNRRVNALTGEVIEEGKEGLYLDKDKAVDSLLSQLNKSNPAISLVTYKEQPVETKVFPAEGLVPGRFEGKYIDVDLVKQQLCRIEGQNVLDCFTISSGKPSMPTPVGTFYIQSKNPKAWSAQYGLWMPYWQQFNGPYGLHELPEWPNGYKEGQDHLGIPVSHGCVRLGIGDAATVFNWTEIGTPVYIHK